MVAETAFGDCVFVFRKEPEADGNLRAVEKLAGEGGEGRRTKTECRSEGNAVRRPQFVMRYFQVGHLVLRFSHYPHVELVRKEGARRYSYVGVVEGRDGASRNVEFRVSNMVRSAR